MNKIFGGLMPKYNLINQEKYCCVPCALQMIFDRHGFDFYLSQIDIAYEMGLSVPEEFLKDFPKAKIAKESKDVGVHPGSQGTSLNSFFKRHNLPFREDYKKCMFSTIDSIYESMKNELIRNNDVMFGLDFGMLDKKERNFYGHVVLIEAINKDFSLDIVIPETEKNKGTYRMNVDKDTFFNAVLAEDDGLWLIKNYIIRMEG
jgi:hypothetical protein